MEPTTTGINWGEIATQMLIIILPILFAAILAVLGTLWRRFAPLVQAKIESSLTLDQRKQAEAIIRLGVTMAEQVWKRPDVKAEFESKKDLAFDFVNRNLQKYGITLDAEDILAMIEAAVFTEINKDKQAPLVVQGETLVVNEGQSVGTPGKRFGAFAGAETFTSGTYPEPQS